MDIIIDNNLSTRLPRLLAEDYPAMVHVERLGLDTATDLAIWEVAQRDRYHILTKGSDFRAIQLLRGHPPKIIWLRCGNVNTSFIVALLKQHRDTIHRFLQHPNPGMLQIS